MDAVASVARGIRAGDYEVAIAGGVESMSRAPFIMPKADTAFSRGNQIFDTTIGWRFINPKMEACFGVDTMPETADNVASEYNAARADQDAFALRSQQRWAAADAAGIFVNEIYQCTLSTTGQLIVIDRDEHPRPETNLEKLDKLGGINGPKSTVTAGNASGVNDGAAALLLASTKGLKTHGLKSIASIRGVAPPAFLDNGYWSCASNTQGAGYDRACY